MLEITDKTTIEERRNFKRLTEMNQVFDLQRRYEKSVINTVRMVDSYKQELINIQYRQVELYKLLN